MKMKHTLLVIMLLLTIIYASYTVVNGFQHQKELPASGTIETTDIQVGSRVGGRVTNVLQKEGSLVSIKTPLIQFESYQLPAQKQALLAQKSQILSQLDALKSGARPQELSRAYAMMQQAKAQAALVSAGPRSQDIEQARARQKETQSALYFSERSIKRLEALFEKHVISQQELDNARNAFNSAQEKNHAATEQLQTLLQGSRVQEKQAAQAAYKAQEAQYNLLKAGSRSQDIDAVKAQVLAIEAQLEQLKQTENELRVLSPCTCIISSLDLKPGQLVLPNQTLGTLLNLNDLWVKVFIPEESFGNLHEGSSAQIKVDAYPHETFTGKVVQLGTKAEFTPRNVQTRESRKILVFSVKVAIDNTKNKLRPGMPADVTFKLD
jgi:HlyD family secretion protein